MRLRPTVTVVLTCTVTPQFDVAQSNPDERVKEYTASIARWLDHLRIKDQLIVVENSGFDMRHLLPHVQRGPNVDILQSDVPADADLRRGKGWLETLMLRTASTYARSGVMVKITGRLDVINFGKILNDLPTSPPSWISARLRF